jgi:hypothetical protein
MYIDNTEICGVNVEKQTTRTVEVIKQIMELTNYRRNMIDLWKADGPGRFVVTGPQPGWNPLKHVGYCVQVRKQCGQYRSDMVFLRHPDGSLTTHENQSFFAMTAEQEVLAREIFEVLPEDEDFSQGFSCTDKIREIGYVIENSASKASSAHSTVMMTTTEAQPDGSVKKTFTAFI